MRTNEWKEGTKVFFSFLILCCSCYLGLHRSIPFLPLRVLFFVLVLSPVLVLSRTTFIQTNNSRNMDWDEFKAYVLSSFEVYILTEVAADVSSKLVWLTAVKDFTRRS